MKTKTNRKNGKQKQSKKLTVIANTPEVCFMPAPYALAQMRAALTQFYKGTLKDASAVEEKVQHQLRYHFPQLSQAAVR